MTWQQIQMIFYYCGFEVALEEARESGKPWLITEVEHLELKRIEAESPRPVRYPPIQYGMPLSELDRLAAARKVAT